MHVSLVLLSALHSSQVLLCHASIPDVPSNLNIEFLEVDAFLLPPAQSVQRTLMYSSYL